MTNSDYSEDEHLLHDRIHKEECESRPGKSMKVNVIQGEYILKPIIVRNTLLTVLGYRYVCYTHRPYHIFQCLGFGWTPMEAYKDWLNNYKKMSKKSWFKELLNWI